MTKVELGQFKTRLAAAIAEYNNRYLPELERQHAKKNQIELADVDGKARNIAIEAHARAYFINPMLAALGWDVSRPENIVIEDGQNGAAAAEDEHRCFLDYHGRELAGDDAVSLLLVEAKRPSKSLPSPGREGVAERIRMTLEAINSGNKPGREVSAEWATWLTDLVRYVARLSSNYGHTPSSVLITNGDWFVVFTSVDRSLRSPDVRMSDILVIENQEAAIAKAESLYRLLAYSELSTKVPPQHPAALSNYVNGANRVGCVFRCEISYTRHGQTQPAIGIKVGALVEGARGGWVRFELQHNPEYVVLRQDHIVSDISLIRDRALGLVEALRRHIPAGTELDLIPASRYESRFDGSTQQAPTDLGGQIDFAEENVETLFKTLNPTANPIYDMVTGDRPGFIERRPQYDVCDGHDWKTCSSSGNQHGTTPMVAASVQPRSFFTTGSPFHCAHEAVHQLRKNKCIISELEEYMCCRQCAYFERCWTDGGAALPCTERQPPSHSNPFLIFKDLKSVVSVFRR